MPVQVHPIAQAATFLATGPGNSQAEARPWRQADPGGEDVPRGLDTGVAGEGQQHLPRSLTGGSVQKTVEQMDANAADKCLKRLAKDTAELAAETEQARSQARSRK